MATITRQFTRSATYLMCIMAIGVGLQRSRAACALPDGAAPATASGEIVTVRYCKFFNSVDVAELEIRIRVTNTGAQDILLSRTPEFSALRISRSRQDFEDGRYEYDGYEDIVARSPTKLQKRDIGVYVLALAPSQTAEVTLFWKQNIAAMDSDTALLNNSGILPPGPHVLQFSLSTWSESMGGDKTIGKWLKQEHSVAVSTVAVAPIDFTVPLNRVIEDCKLTTYHPPDLHLVQLDPIDK